MMSVHSQPWHTRAGRPQKDHCMAIRDLERHLIRLEQNRSGSISFGAALEAAHQRRKECERAWRAAVTPAGHPSRLYHHCLRWCAASLLA
jgi:hypothetical protein